MKKFLVVLLILAVAGGAFAQVTFTGHLRGGLAVLLSDAVDADPSFGQKDVPNALGARFDLQAAWANPDNIAGLRVLLRAVTPANINLQATDPGQGLFPHVYEAWFKAFDGLLTITGGKMDRAGVFGTGGGVDANLGIGDGTGFHLDLEPMSGLNFRLVTAAGAGPDSTFAAYTGAGFKDLRINFGARYLVPDVVDVVGIYRNRAYTAAVSERANDVALAFKVLALKPVGFSTFILDFNISDIGKVLADYILFQAGQNIQFVTGDLTAGLRMRQDIRIGDDSTGYSPDLTFQAYVQYLINGAILPRLDVGFNIGSPVLQNIELRGNWDGLNKGICAKDNMNFNLSPSVQFRFGAANQNIQLGYVLQMDLSDGATATATAATVRNTIYASYAIVF